MIICVLLLSCGNHHKKSCKHEPSLLMARIVEQQILEKLLIYPRQNSSIHPVCVDLMDWDATRKAIADIGSIVFLVNNAGVASLQSFLEVDKDSLDE